MKLKQLIPIIIFIVLLTFIFKEPIFQSLISYKVITTTNHYTLKNKSLQDFVDSNFDYEKNYTEYEIINKCLQLTKTALIFKHDKKNYNDPNKLINSKYANSNGYSSFCSTIINYVFRKKGKDLLNYNSIPQKGHIYVLNINLQKITKFLGLKILSSKGHDFVCIENRSSKKKKICIDPVIYEFCYIKEISIIN